MLTVSVNYKSTADSVKLLLTIGYRGNHLVLTSVGIRALAVTVLVIVVFVVAVIVIVVLVIVVLVIIVLIIVVIIIVVLVVVIPFHDIAVVVVRPRIFTVGLARRTIGRVLVVIVSSVQIPTTVAVLIGIADSCTLFPVVIWIVIVSDEAPNR